MIERSTESIVERIKSLLRLADDQEGTPEGELAAKLANKIIREHAIEMSLLQEKTETISQTPLEVGRSNWMRNLMDIVAEFCSCRAWIISGTRTMEVAGYENDLEICFYLFDLIKNQIEWAADKHLRELACIGIKGGKRISTDFKISAVVGVREKLRGIKSASVAEDPTGTALVLSRSQLVQNWVEDNIRLNKNTSKIRYNHNPYGYETGKSVRLSPGVRGDSEGPPQIGPGRKLLKG